MSQTPWLTVREVADQLQVTEETVRRWIRRGELGALELGGPRTVYRIRSDDLDHFMWQRYNRPMQAQTSPNGASPGAPDFQDMVEHLPVAIFLFDPEQAGAGAITYMSSEIEDLLGVPREEWYEDLEAVWRGLVPDGQIRALEAQGTNFRAIWEKAGGSEQDHFATEVLLQSRSGELLWFAVDLELVRSSSGEPLHWYGVLVDITERKRIEHQLHERVSREKRLSAFSQRAVEEESVRVLFEEAARLITEALHVEYSKIFEVMPGSNYLTLQAAVGWAPGRIGVEEVDAGPVGDIQIGAHGDSQSAYTLSCGEAVVTTDLTRERRFNGAAMAQQYGVRSGITVIIPGKGRPFGILGAHSIETRALSNGDVGFVQAVANVLAMAVSRSGAHWMTIPEVAETLQVNIETVRRWIRSGDLSAVMLGGPRTGYRIHSSDLEKFTAQRLTF